MKIKLDKDGDALYFRLQSGAIIESEEVRPGVVLDFDENDRVIGVEFLRVSARASSGLDHRSGQASGRRP